MLGKLEFNPELSEQKYQVSNCEISKQAELLAEWVFKTDEKLIIQHMAEKHRSALLRVHSLILKVLRPKPPQELVEQAKPDSQQLKAEIAAIATEFDNLGPGSCGGEHLNEFYKLVIKLRQLSAV